MNENFVIQLQAAKLQYNFAFCKHCAIKIKTFYQKIKYSKYLHNYLVYYYLKIYNNVILIDEFIGSELHQRQYAGNTISPVFYQKRFLAKVFNKEDPASFKVNFISSCTIYL